MDCSQLLILSTPPLVFNRVRQAPLFLFYFTVPLQKNPFDGLTSLDIKSLRRTAHLRPRCVSSLLPINTAYPPYQPRLPPPLIFSSHFTHQAREQQMNLDLLGFTATPQSSTVLATHTRNRISNPDYTSRGFHPAEIAATILIGVELGRRHSSPARSDRGSL